MTDFQRQGWVRFYRKSIDSTVWKNPIIWMVWSWCLLKANHTDNKFPFNGDDITLEKGQFITGIEKAILELKGVTRQNYRTAIKYLEKTGRLTTKSTNKFTIITIVKWEEYQKDNTQSNKPLTNHQQTTNKPLTTNNNVKNVKNDNNIPKNKKTFKDGYTIELGDGTTALLRFGVWVDNTPPFTPLDRNFYKELP